MLVPRILLTCFVTSCLFITTGCTEEYLEYTIDDNTNPPTTPPVVEDPIDQPGYYVATSGDDDDEGTIDKPWRTIDKSLKKLKAGDTLFLRGGTYYESNISKFPVGEATASARITVTNYADETVIVNGGKDLSDESLWEQQGNSDKYRYIYTDNISYNNLSQDGQPLRLMNTKNTDDLNELNGDGQWIRDNDSDGIWVQVKGGGNPGKRNIEISSATSVFSIPDCADFITLEGITVENAYYPVRVKDADYVELKNLVVRNAYGDAIKVEGWHRDGDYWDSEHGIIEDSNIYYFGESAVDITGGDYWTIRGNLIHDASPIAGDDSLNGFYSNGFMIKNENIGVLIEDNIIYDMFATFGVISLGGNTYYDDITAITEDAIVRNNEFRNITAPFIVTFTGALNSTFENNLIVDSSLQDSSVSQSVALIQFREGYCDRAECKAVNGGEKIYWRSEGNSVINNNFKNNNAEYNYKEWELHGQDNDTDTVIENNTSSEKRNSYFDNREFTPEQLIQEKGYY